VMSLFNLVFNGMSRVGALVVGGVAELTGTAWALGASAALALLVSVGLIRGLPDVDRLP